ncbi:MAG: hypothetical protein IPJ34_01910 [Myxococcales bacterium]|nr:hypothetical protein [Myxococcales bacterium]MBL8716486.1 hypothetical protein [Myxococcales bacterium]
MRKIPPYAEHIPLYRLVSIPCLGCKARRWAELVNPPAGVRVPPTLPFPGQVAKCLVCGLLHADKMGWVGP